MTRGTDMAKKKENVDCESDFKTHELRTGFFDKLIECIPARFYLADETERNWFPGLSKSRKARAKKITNSTNLKKARRDRLDSYKSALTTVESAEAKAI